MRRIQGCCEYFIEFNVRNHHIALGKYNPNSDGSWWIAVDDIHYLIRHYIFWWSKWLQGWLYKRKIYWHNWFIDECTPGFECCMHKAKDDMKQVLKNIVRANEEQIGSVCIKQEQDKLISF